MQAIAFTLTLIEIVLIGYASLHGFDLRKPASWLYSIFGFCGGLVTAFLIGSDLMNAMATGAAFALLILVAGAARYWRGQRYESMAGTLLLQYGNEDRPSLFARLIEKLLRVLC